MPAVCVSTCSRRSCAAAEGSHARLLAWLATRFPAEAIEVDGRRWSRRRLDPARPHDLAVRVASLARGAGTRELRAALDGVEALGTPQVTLRTVTGAERTLSRAPLCPGCGRRLPTLRPEDFRNGAAEAGEFRLGGRTLAEFLALDVAGAQEAFAELEVLEAARAAADEVTPPARRACSGRARLPPPRPRVADALARRGAAGSARRPAGEPARGPPPRARRADDRTRPGAGGEPDRAAGPAARPGPDGRARPTGGRARRRRRRDRSRRRPGRRQRRVPGAAGGAVARRHHLGSVVLRARPPSAARSGRSAAAGSSCAARPSATCEASTALSPSAPSPSSPARPAPARRRSCATSCSRR